MTGNAKAPTKAQAGWFARLRQLPRHYFAIDGGSGAHLLAALSERDPYLRQVASPRHADLLIIVEPVSQKLAPAIVDVAKALARPAHVLLVGEPAPELEPLSDSGFARLEDLLPGARRLSQASVEAILDVVPGAERWSELAQIDAPGREETTIQLPRKHEQEMATELVVLSLGPIQPFTAGPLRLFLICDGEQVLSAQVESGYAHRGIAGAMRQTGWQQALDFARLLDPLAPVASQLAYVRAVEQLQGWQPSPQLLELREAALALERVHNTLWWLVRFARILADAEFIDRSYHLATEFATHASHIWQQPPIAWIAPGQSVVLSAVSKNTSAISHLHICADHVETMSRYVERNRWLALRTRGIGFLAIERLKAAGVSGPVLFGSEHGAGDVQSRLTARIHAATIDLCAAAETLVGSESSSTQGARWEIPAGEAHATVTGPRGDIGLHLVSDGGEKPVLVEWQRPSSALLPLLPEIVAGQKLVDAEVIVASLDLVMAEADG